LAQRCGIDGVQVSFDDPGTKTDLRREDARKLYADTTKKTGVVTSSLAMGILNRKPYATEDLSEQWVLECIEVMPRIGQRIVLLAFFGE